MHTYARKMLIMTKLTASSLTKAALETVVTLHEQGIDDYDWLQVASIPVTEAEAQRLQYLQGDLLNCQVQLLNESTVWARAIYPLLLLSEQRGIQAWAGVPLKATYAQFEIDSIADGAIGRAASGSIEAPFIVVVEAKKGIEAQNPLFWLYAELLAAARLNVPGQRVSLSLLAKILRVPQWKNQPGNALFAAVPLTLPGQSD